MAPRDKTACQTFPCKCKICIFSIESDVYNKKKIQMFVVNMTFISSREVKKCIFHECLRHSWNIHFFTSLDEIKVIFTPNIWISSIYLFWLLKVLDSRYSLELLGMFGWGKGVMYLTSPGRPAETGLQLGKACYPCCRYTDRGEMFLFLPFLHFPLSPQPSLSYPLLSFLSLFSLSLGDDTKWPRRVAVSLNSSTVSQ